MTQQTIMKIRRACLVLMGAITLFILFVQFVVPYISWHISKNNEIERIEKEAEEILNYDRTMPQYTDKGTSLEWTILASDMNWFFSEIHKKYNCKQPIPRTFVPGELSIHIYPNINAAIQCMKGAEAK